MIELMLEAERAIGIGLLDNAERLYLQVVAADPRNAIAVTGLARVALERGDQRAAYTFARRALALDPDNPMADHLSRRMAEQIQNRGEPLPDEPLPDEPLPDEPPADAMSATPAATWPPAPAPGPHPGSAATGNPPPAPPPPARPGLFDRWLRRRR